MADIEISYIKPFIFITGVLSLILPWFYEINFLGVFFTYQSVSLIINDLMVFGLFYLVGLSFNFIFFKYNGEINYFIGFLSLCLVIIGPIGYYALLITRLLEYQRRLDREIEFVLGPGFYFMLLTIALIVLEIYYLKKGGFALKLKVYKQKEEK